MDKREYLKELRDPPERVIDAIAGMEGPCMSARAREVAIERWQKAIDALVYQ